MGSKKHRNGTSTARLEREERERRIGRRRNRGRQRVVIAVVVLVIGALVTTFALSGGGDDAAAVPYVGTTLEVPLGDFSIGGNLTAPAGNVRLHATNGGGTMHNVGVRRGPISKNLQSGEDTMLDLGTLAPGTYELYCDVPGHVQLGMVAPLVITAG